MLMKKKTIAVAVALTMLVMVALAGCAGGKGNSPASSNPPATGTKENGSSAAGATDDSAEPRIKLKMFMSNSGVPHPEGVDPSDNPMLKIVEDYANVDIEMEVPNYDDFQTKFNLMLSSGNLPDIVQTEYAEEADMRGDEGAFIDLKSFYDNSPVMQKVITPEMMEMAKSASGKYYRIPMSRAEAAQGDGIIVRYDLLEKYNGGKWPETVEEWVDMLRKLKQGDPDSIPMTNRVLDPEAISYSGLPFFYWYGAMPYTYRVVGGEAVSTFTLPEYKEAVQVMKRLYDEGLLDREFATNDTPKWVEKWNNRNVLFGHNGADQYIPKNDPKLLASGKDYVFAPPLKQYPSVLQDTKYVQPFRKFPINKDSVYISSKAKDKERAWKVLEGFATEQLKDTIFWGIENEDYKVENGQKVPIEGEGLSNPNKTYRLHFGIVLGFYSGTDRNIASARQAMKPEQLERQLAGLDTLAKAADEQGLRVADFITPEPDVSLKQTESHQFISTATVEAIMGKISLEQFDGKVAEYQQKYGFIYGQYTDYIKANKEQLLSLGVKEAGW